MTNKPMLSVERELLERLTENWNGTDARIELRTLLDKPVCHNCAGLERNIPCPECKPAAQHQGDPVAICRLWNEGGSGERTSVEFIKEPCPDGTLLYTDQYSPVIKPSEFDFNRWWVEVGARLTKHEVGLKDLMQCAFEAVPAIKQADPVCAQIRYRRPEMGCPDWGEWHDLKLSRFDKNRTHYIDNAGWECQTRVLFAEQSLINKEVKDD